MSADQIFAGVVVAFFVAAFVINALTDDGPPEHFVQSHVPPPTWPDYLGETDLPHVPVARVEDVPAIWGGEVVTGEVYDELPPAPRRVGMNGITRRDVVEPEPNRIEPNIRQIGAGR